MKPNKTTQIIVAAGFLLWLLVGALGFYDLYLFWYGHKTLSDIMTIWIPCSHPVIAFFVGGFLAIPSGFIIGLLYGHWFWPNYPTDKYISKSKDIKNG